MTDLDYEATTLCGPVDMRVVHFIENYRGYKFDPAYLLHIQKWHGGIPGKQYFDAADGKTYRLGRFLTLVDEETELEPPSRRSWEHPERDIRIDWSVLTLIDEEGPSCRNLHGGDRLLPIANLYWRDQHPDGIGLGEGVLDIIAFDYYSPERPRVVICLADKADLEYDRWDRALVASNWEAEEQVRYEDFTVDVAESFETFVSLLRSRL